MQEVADHYATNNIPFIVAGWQKRRKRSGDEASVVKKIHITYIAPKKILDDSPRYDPAVLVRPRLTASVLDSEGGLQQGYMAALEEDMVQDADADN